MTNLRTFSVTALLALGLSLAVGRAAAQTISVHPGITGCTGAAALNIPAAGGTADFHVCVNAPVTRTCGVGFNLSASASNGMTISARTLGASYADPFQANGTYLNGTNNALDPDTANAGAVISDVTSFVAAANGIVAASFTLTVPAAVAAGNYTVGPTGGLLNITGTTCDDFDAGGASDFTPAATVALVVNKAGVVATPSVTIAASPATLVDAAANVSTVTVTSSAAAPAGGLVVNLTPAAANARYTTTCGATITILAAATTATCTVTATANTTAGDGSATATTALAAPSASYTLGATTSAVVTINDNDVAAVPSVTIAASPTTLVDAAANVSTITVTSSVAASAGGLVVNLTPAAANARYTTTCGATITILAAATTATCSVTATANTTAGDGSATATTALAAPSASYTLGATTSAAVAINDNDVISVTIAASPATLVDAAANVSTITVTSSLAAPAGGLVVNLTPAAASARYATTCGATITIAAAATTTTCTVTATANVTSGDGSATATTALAAPSASYTLGATTSAAVTINDDDVAPTASVAAGAATITEGNTATFTLSCTGPATLYAIPYTVNTIAGDGVPTPASPASLTCGTPLSITVTTTDNAVQGDSRSLTLTLGALPSGLTLGTGAASVTVQDNDAPTVAAIVPTLGAFGIGLMALLIAGFGALTQRRRKQ
jgi:IPTL-CTERM motif